MAYSILACNLNAISAVERPRYNDLVTRVRAAMRDRRELPDGYSYLLDPVKIMEPELSEWIAMERVCCPFLILQLEGAGDVFRLAMRGPEGVKALLEEEFPNG